MRKTHSIRTASGTPPSTSTSSTPEFTISLEQIKLSKIMNHPINPDNRGKRIEDLKKDKLLREGRLVNPLKVVKNGANYTLLDGHRRKAALEAISKDKDSTIRANLKVDCIVYSITSKNATDKSSIYASLNTVRPHKGDEKAAIYLEDDSYLSESDRKKHKEADKGLTRKNFRLCIDNEISPTSIWSDIKTTAGRCKPSSGRAEFQALLFKWMFPGGKEIRTKELRKFKSDWSYSQANPTRHAKVIKDFIAEVKKTTSKETA